MTKEERKKILDKAYRDDFVNSVALGITKERQEFITAAMEESAEEGNPIKYVDALALWMDLQLAKQVILDL